MRENVERIEDKLDKALEMLSDIRATVAAHSVKLTQHSNADVSLTGKVRELEDKLEPISRHVSMVSGAMKLVALVATLAAIGEGISVTAEFIGKELDRRHISFTHRD